MAVFQKKVLVEVNLIFRQSGIFSPPYPIVRPERCHFYLRNRITSYNVCYTKLLREKSDSLQLKLFFEKLPFNSLRMISEYNNSWLFGHSEGFSQVFIDTLKRTPYQINSIDIGRVLEFVQIDDSVIWAGSDRGMYRLEYTKDQTKGFKQTHHFTAGDNEYSISNNNIISVSKDNSGGLWIGSNGGGVCKLSKLNRQFKSYKSTLTSGSLSTIV